MDNNREHKVLTWKQEALIIFQAILNECEADEAYEECAKIKANMDYIKAVPLTITDDELVMPHPYEMIQDEESIFLRYTMDEDVEDLRKAAGKNNRKMRDKEEGEDNGTNN